MLGVLLMPPLLGISPLGHSWLFLLLWRNSPLNPSNHQSMLDLLLLLLFFFCGTNSSSLCHHISPVLLPLLFFFFFLANSSQNSSFHHSLGFRFFLSVSAFFFCFFCGPFALLDSSSDEN
ncbi:hypothetical protein HanRHA438_Chr06g0254231 [Helianthus annuus]|nr:hypothetical protein HanIR_Chr06g0263461 [Helianthus annuus]KAJ0910616.1 hypothetical protein HanRHA438_Chr06g0254231 [Helianthus annuus]